MAINMLSQQYMKRESSGCEADTENSTAESGSYNFEADENNFSLRVSPAKKGKKQKKEKKEKRVKKRPKAKTKNQKDLGVRSETETDNKLKRKFSSLGLSEKTNAGNISEESDHQTRQKKKKRSSVTFDISKDENMDCEMPGNSEKPCPPVASDRSNDENMDCACPSQEKVRDSFISPIGGIPELVVYKKPERFAAIKETSTPVEPRPTHSSSDDGFFGFTKIMDPEPEVSPVLKITSMEYMTSRPSMSPTDLGSPDLRGAKKAHTRSLSTDSKGTGKPGVRRSKRISYSPDGPPPPETVEMCCISQKAASPVPKPGRRSSKRLSEQPTTDSDTVKSGQKNAKLAVLNVMSKKTKASRSSKRSSVVSNVDESAERMDSTVMTTMDSGIAMSFQDSNVSYTSPTKDEPLFLAVHHEPKAKVSTGKRVTGKQKPVQKESKREKKSKQYDHWASKLSDEFTDIENNYDLVIAS